MNRRHASNPSSEVVTFDSFLEVGGWGVEDEEDFEAIADRVRRPRRREHEVRLVGFDGRKGRGRVVL